MDTWFCLVYVIQDKYKNACFSQKSNVVIVVGLWVEEKYICGKNSVKSQKRVEYIG